MEKEMVKEHSLGNLLGGIYCRDGRRREINMLVNTRMGKCGTEHVKHKLKEISSEKSFFS